MKGGKKNDRQMFKIVRTLFFVYFHLALLQFSRLFASVRRLSSPEQHVGFLFRKGNLPEKQTKNIGVVDFESPLESLKIELPYLY